MKINQLEEERNSLENKLKEINSQMSENSANNEAKLKNYVSFNLLKFANNFFVNKKKTIECFF